ncbi:MAG: tetratricopeptide repeat protein [Sphingomonadales bacterium]
MVALNSTAMRLILSFLFSVVCCASVFAAEPAAILSYETLVEPAPVARTTKAEAIAAYEAEPNDETLARSITGLIRIGEAKAAWALLEDHPVSSSAAYFKAKLDAVNANLASAGSLGKLKWAKRLRVHCSGRLDAVPEDEDALECVAKFHYRAPSVAGGDAALGIQALERLKTLNMPRAALAEAELIFKEDPERAHALVDEAVKQSDIHDQGLLQAAMVFGYFKEWDRTEETLSRISDSSPMSGMRHYQMGKLSAEHGEKLKAGEQALLRFLSGETQHFGVDFRGPAHWRIGQIFQHQQRFELARQAYETALDYNPRLKSAKADLKALDKIIKNQG